LLLFIEKPDFALNLWPKDRRARVANLDGVLITEAAGRSLRTPAPAKRTNQARTTMGVMRLLKVGLLAVLVAWIIPRPAGAEMNLSDLEGEWSGGGTDRDSPFASLQKSSCRSKIRSDVHRMSNEIVCSGPSGSRKTIQLQITMQGDQISGDLVQTQATGTMKGSVSGRRRGDSADMQIQFSGLMPSATAKFIVINPSSYTLRVATMGTSMMDVTFKKVGAAGQAAQPGPAR
jgi:hypothetical protein